MKLLFKTVLLTLSAVLVLSSAQAKNKHGKGDNGSYDPRDQQEESYSSSSDSSSNSNSKAADYDLVKAAAGRKRVNFAEGSGMTVIQILPDDNSGLKHQKWVVRLSDGTKMQAVYNSDMCPRVPVKVGDVVAMGGMFLWTEQGAMLHWLHHDPKGTRPDGYVYLNGTYYCKN